MGGGGGCDGETSGVGILEPQLRKKKTVGIKAKASSFLCIIGVKKKASKRKARHLDVPRPTQTGGMIRDSYLWQFERQCYIWGCRRGNLRNRGRSDRRVPNLWRD